MTRNRRLLVCLGVISVGSLSFGAGRWSVSTREGLKGNKPGLVSARSNAAQPLDSPQFEKVDLSAVKIENLGEVDFEQAYALLRSAGKETLVEWTMRLQALPTSPHKTAGITAFFKTLAQMDTGVAAELALKMDRHEPRWTAILAVTKAAPAANLAENRKTHQAAHNDRPISDILAEFSAVRGRIVDRLARMTPAQLARTSLHPRLQQPMSVVDLCFFVAEHDDHHLRTIHEMRDA